MALPFYNVPPFSFGDLRRDGNHALVVTSVAPGGGGTSGPGFALPNTSILAPLGLFQGATSGPAGNWALAKVLGVAPTPNTYLHFIDSAAIPAGGETPELSLLAYPSLDYEVNFPYGLQFNPANTIFMGWSNTPGVYNPGPYGSFRMIITIP